MGRIEGALSELEAQYRERHRGAGEFRHWHVEVDEDQVLWAYLDKQGSAANTLDADVLGEFESILDSLPSTSPRALVLGSLKRSGFCAGADITQFREFDSKQIRDLLQRGHRILDRLENLSLPTVAVIHGHCLGGGLELALACDYRIGVSGALEVGFPEIRLGLHPGLGGTFRLMESVGPLRAMTLMLTGRSLHEKQVLSQGLVQHLVAARLAHNAVKAVLAAGPAPRKASRIQRLASFYLLRLLIARRMKARAGQRAPAEHYPAPGALVDLWRRCGGSRLLLQKAETESFVRLIETPASRNLVRVFSLQEKLKRAVDGESGVCHVHVIGAGAMGGDIAAWCALQGMKVSLSDVKIEQIAAAVNSVIALGRNRHRSPRAISDALDRLIPDPSAQGLRQADLIIEAVPENIEIKRSLYETVEPLLKVGAILATNTSSIPLEKLATFLADPDRLVGLHFFNPVASMRIVEVVSHAATDNAVRQQALAFTRSIGKLPVAVNSYPGFLVNRALTPYVLEAVLLLDEGMSRDQIDAVATDFGMPVGPLELADQVGLDVCVQVADMLQNLLDTPMPQIPGWLRDKVERGHLGKKTGEGFYRWRNGRVQKRSGSVRLAQSDRDACQDRLILPMLNACMECYRRNVVESVDQLDGAMVFATGFAPFRGGPMHYASSRGVASVVDSLQQLADRHGNRFLPDDGWKEF